MLPVFDGHNDALTRDDHRLFASGRDDGHLDLPRMRAGGIRGGIFAVFTPSSEDSRTQVPRDDGVVEFALAEPVSRADAAAFATAVAGRLLALERSGDVRVGRRIADVDEAFADGYQGPPIAVLHLEGAEAIDPQLEALDSWYAAGLRSLGPVWSRPSAFGEGVPFAFPSRLTSAPG